MAFVRLQTAAPGAGVRPSAVDHRYGQATHGPDWYAKSRAWIAAKRPAADASRTSWYVIIAAACVAIALVWNPTFFFTAAIVMTLGAFWRRENATQGVLIAAGAALAAGSFLAVASIVWYYL